MWLIRAKRLRPHSHWSYRGTLHFTLTGKPMLPPVISCLLNQATGSNGKCELQFSHTLSPQALVGKRITNPADSLFRWRKESCAPSFGALSGTNKVGYSRDYDTTKKGPYSMPTSGQLKGIYTSHFTQSPTSG
ncbi:hypothetical protein SAMN05216191_104209 [Paenibacillus jilunlii]|uniref:Uncharacterized protein n=1 Tax=Paenibacillus jilunlii TaxID=682956 RepID=A0A1G9LR84_9BACL|nr:hypothetical protein SAMN05216191_104209 [Paenibacillus jilunlii]